uniref:Uncharacterized protein n=1 Tax=Oryza brachyantha TaxID=4533 RepID=J3KYB6_ORYBR
MASLLLLLQAIVSGVDVEEKLIHGERQVSEELERQPERFCPELPAMHQRCGFSNHDVEEEQWLVSCLRWPGVDRQAAWMQTI